MSDSRGLYPKYDVTYAGEKGKLADRFVLSPVTDPIARCALKAYAALTYNHLLANDLNVWLGAISAQVGDYVEFFHLKDVEAAYKATGAKRPFDGFFFVAEDGVYYVCRVMKQQGVVEAIKTNVVANGGEEASAYEPLQPIKYELFRGPSLEDVHVQPKPGLVETVAFGPDFRRGRPVKVTREKVPCFVYGVLGECKPQMVYVVGGDLEGRPAMVNFTAEEYQNGQIEVTFLT